MPIAARIAVVGAIVALCAGATLLLLSRGPALLLDLSASAANLLCL